MAKMRSAVSYKKSKVKSAASKKVSKVKSAASKKVKSAKSASSKKVSKVKSAASKKVSSAKSAAKDFKSSIGSAADPKLRGVNPLGEAPVISAISAAVPFQEGIDLQQDIAETQQNIYDPEIGYGLANPGETGIDAVERIKKKRRVKARRK